VQFIVVETGIPNVDFSASFPLRLARKSALQVGKTGNTTCCETHSHRFRHWQGRVDGLLGHLGRPSEALVGLIWQIRGLSASY